MGKKRHPGSPPGPPVLVETDDGVTVLTMNRPRRLNGWTNEMIGALKQALADAADDPATKAVILTGKGKYYCAGVNLGGAMKPDHPARLHAAIVAHNQALFDAFLDCPKPILVAMNGPVIGAATTSATLCDAIIAVPEATLSTPFARLGITPEGCSSVLFERVMGAASAQRMLGPEGWQPNASEAVEVGLVQEVVAAELLMERSRELAQEWIAAGKKRRFHGTGELAELKAVNVRESVGIADSFLGADFMKAQARFLWRKGKMAPAVMFASLWATRPLWARMLPAGTES